MPSSPAKDDPSLDTIPSECEKPTAKLVEATGPGPFITLGWLQHVDETANAASPTTQAEKPSARVWRSRHHRKRLASPEELQREAIVRVAARCLWMPSDLNWWIGSIFAIGATCFAVASLFVLSPSLATLAGQTDTTINQIYFAGSIPFTLAAYLQLFQAANMPPKPNERPANGASRAVRLIGWKPDDIGWLSCALQFLGTLLFNVNTFNAMQPSLSWSQYNVSVWIPNFVGSVLFLASGYLAFIETCHTFWAWRHASLAWWIVFINLLGCIGFMISAVLAIQLSQTPSPTMTTLSVVFTLQGAVCFFLGAILMLPETALKAETANSESGV